jgi:hypothetical protein
LGAFEAAAGDVEEGGEGEVLGEVENAVDDGGFGLLPGKVSVVDEPGADGLFGEEGGQVADLVDAEFFGEGGGRLFDPVAEMAGGVGEIEESESEGFVILEDHAGAIALVLGGGVGGVFTPGVVVGEIVAEGLAANGEEGAVDGEAWEGGVFGHAGEADDAGAAEEALEDGFGLVVGVMGEENASEVVLLADFAEEGETEGAVAGGGVGGQGDGDAGFEVGEGFDGAGEVELVG